MYNLFRAVVIASLTCSFACHLEAQVSYSLCDSQGTPLDHKLVKLLNKKNGVFIEVGAADGVNQSNTKLLEDVYGWTGILIEPAPAAFKSLIGHRPRSKCFQCALGSDEENGTYVLGDFDGNLMASVNGTRLRNQPKYKVLIRSLQSILDETNIQHVDFFSLDTEGYELNILKGIDFNKTTFDYILVEIYKHQYDDIVSFLNSKGYDMIDAFTNYNHITNPRWDGTHNDYLFSRKGKRPS